MPVTLPAILALIAAAYSVEWHENPPDVPAGTDGTDGITDAQLWHLIATDGDVMQGMNFTNATNNDPRRVDALIQQRLLGEFFVWLEAARGGVPAQVLRDTWFLRNQGIRQAYGDISAAGLAEDLAQSWAEYEKVYTGALWPMAEGGRPEAQALLNGIIQYREEIFRAFRECSAIATRAAFVSIRQEDQEAWGRMVATIDSMWDTVNAQLVALEQPVADDAWRADPEEVVERLLGRLPDPVREPPEGEMVILPVPVEEEGEEYGSVSEGVEEAFGETLQDYFASGHRAPGADTAQWRRSGGRFY